MNFFRMALGLLIFLSLSANIAFGQSNISDDEVNAVAKGLYCPVCESEPLDTCPTQACIDWREEIRLQLSNGANQEEIHQYFQDRYGDRVLAQPPASGLNWLLWLTIPFGLVVGGLFFGRYLKSISTETPTSTAPSPKIDEIEDPYIRQIEKDLQQHS